MVHFVFCLSPGEVDPIDSIGASWRELTLARDPTEERAGPSRRHRDEAAHSATTTHVTYIVVSSSSSLLLPPACVPVCSCPCGEGVVIRSPTWRLAAAAASPRLAFIGTTQRGDSNRPLTAARRCAPISAPDARDGEEKEDGRGRRQA